MSPGIVRDIARVLAVLGVDAAYAGDRLALILTTGGSHCQGEQDAEVDNSGLHRDGNSAEWIVMEWS